MLLQRYNFMKLSWSARDKPRPIHQVNLLSLKNTIVDGHSTSSAQNLHNHFQRMNNDVWKMFENFEFCMLYSGSASNFTYQKQYEVETCMNMLSGYKLLGPWSLWKKPTLFSTKV